MTTENETSTPFEVIDSTAAEVENTDTPPTPAVTTTPNTDTGGAAEPPKNPLEREKVFYLPVSDIDTKVDALLQARGKNVRLDGFRPGKVPKSVLVRSFGKAALSDVLNEEGAKILQEKIEEDGEYPAAQPHVHPSVVAGEQGYEIKCHYEVLPTIEAPDFTDHKLTIPTLSVTDKEVDEMVEILREQRGNLVARESGAVVEDTDFVLLDFKTQLKDKEDVVEEGEERRVRLSAPNLLPEIRDALRTAKIDDKLNVDIKLPEHHPQAEFRSQAAVMAINVKKVEQIEKPALDDAFFTEFGVKEGGLSAFRQVIQEHLDREVTIRLRQMTQRTALNKLLEATPPFPLPMSMWVSEVKNLQQQYAQSKEASPPNMEALMAEAQQRVMLGLVLSSWQKRHNVQISDEEMTQQINQTAAMHEDEAAAKEQIRGDQHQMQMMHLAVMENKVTQWVKDNVTLSEESIDLQSLLEMPG